MKQQFVLLAAALVFIAATMFSSCSKSDAKADSSGVKKEQAVSVQVQELKLSLFTDAIQVTGVVKAFEDVMLSPEEGGVIKEWKVQKGRAVKKGEILALMKDDILQPSYDAANAQYKLSELNFEKQTKVYSEQGISEMQMKSSEYNRDAVKAQASIMAARLEHSRLRSPINGILNDRFVDEGEFAPPAAPIAHLVNTAWVKIAAEVPEIQSANVAIGAPVFFTVDVYPKDTLTGKISYVAAAIAASNRTLPVEVVIPNPKNKLKPEMIARMHILRSAKRNTLLISENIIQLVDRNKCIVYVEQSGKAEERIVKLGGRQGKLVEILDGLKPGDRVITVGFEKLVNGQLVTIAG